MCGSPMKSFRRSRRCIAPPRTLVPERYWAGPTARPARHSLLLRLEHLFDLLLDALVVLAQELLFVLGQYPEGHADEAVLELHVEKVLTVGDPARNLEIEASDTRAVIAEID